MAIEFYQSYTVFEKSLFLKMIFFSDIKSEGWNFNSGNYLFTTDTK